MSQSVTDKAKQWSVSGPIRIAKGTTDLGVKCFVKVKEEVGLLNMFLGFYSKLSTEGVES